MRGSLETIQLDSCKQKLQVTAVTTVPTIGVKWTGFMDRSRSDLKTISTKQQNGMSEHLLHCMLLLHSLSITSTQFTILDVNIKVSVKDVFNPT
jgi:hypothetical protein